MADPERIEFEQVFSDELRKWVMPRRCSKPRFAPSTDPSRPLDHQLFGLALSGGGMRSAVYSLGAVQALAKTGILQKVDYFSTVSGGGYFGTGVASYLAKGKGSWAADQFPFGIGIKNPDAPAKPDDPGDDPDKYQLPERANYSESAATRSARMHGNLLGSSLGLTDRETWSGVGRWLISISLLWAVFLLPALTLLAVPTFFIDSNCEDFRLCWNRADPFAVLDTRWELWLVLSTPVWGFVIGGILSFLPGGDLKTNRSRGSTFVRFLQKTGMYFSLLAAGLIGVVLGVWGFEWLFLDADEEFTGVQVLWSAILGAVGTASLASVIKGIGDFSVPETAIKSASRFLVAFGGMILLVLVILTHYWLLWAFALDRTPFDEPDLKFWLMVGVPVGILVIFGGILAQRTLNFLALFDQYQRRIKQTWGRPGHDHKIMDMPCPEKEDPTCSGKPGCAGSEYLGMPYHLFNTTLNIPGSTGVKTLDRKSDSFVISRLYSGSHITGWWDTGTSSGYKNTTLFQAAGISGSAFSPNMGMFTNRTFSIVMTLFNARLGRWLPNHDRSYRNAFHKTLDFVPGLRTAFDGLQLYWKEMLGSASHKDSYIFLSDGGHFENTGVYELLRRRCKYIILVDESGEPPEPARLNFGGIGIMMRRARVDFGIEIDMDLRTLMRIENPAKPELAGKSESQFAVGTINYPETRKEQKARKKRGDARTTGTFIYIRAAMPVAPWPADIIHYKNKIASEFPNVSTADELFDQPQFESYRKLGHMAGSEVVNAAAGKHGNVEEFFQAVTRCHEKRIAKGAP